MTKLSDIVFQVLSNYQDKDIKNENVKLEIAADIEKQWKNVVKEVAKTAIMKKAVEQLQNRISSNIVTGPGNLEIDKHKR